MLGAWGCRHLCWLVFVFPLDAFPEVELLDHMVILFLISEETHTVFCGGCSNSCSHLQCLMVSFFSTSLSMLTWFRFFVCLFFFIFWGAGSLIIALLTRWYLIVVFIAFPWQLQMLGVFSRVCKLPVHIPWKMSVDTFCPFLDRVVCFFGVELCEFFI